MSNNKFGLLINNNWLTPNQTFHLAKYKIDKRQSTYNYAITILNHPSLEEKEIHGWFNKNGNIILYRDNPEFYKYDLFFPFQNESQYKFWLKKLNK